MNDYILKGIRVDVQCSYGVFMCGTYNICVCVCVSVSMHNCVPAVNNQTSLFPCWALFFSFYVRIPLKHLSGDFSCNGMVLFRFWLHFVSHSDIDELTS